jgi:predicted small metal-binding protein
MRKSASAAPAISRKDLPISRPRDPRYAWLSATFSILSVSQERRMPRKFIDCRDFPSEMNCTVAISADSEKELLDAAVQHAVAVHKHQDSPELREMIKGAIKDGSPR